MGQISENKSEVTVVNVNIQMLIASGEVYGWADDVDSVLDTADKLLEFGGFFFPEVAAVAGVVTKVGGVIRWITGNFKEDKPDPIKKVIEKLAVLEKKIDELGKKMAAQFADLKEFITEVNFLTNISVPTSNLMRFMQDLMNDPSPKALENFQSAYNDRKPLKIAYDLLSFLEHEKTNPLRMAMKADPLRTSTTFNKWADKFASILGQFLFLEAMASGLMKDNDDFDVNLIIQRSGELVKDMDKLKEVYKKDPIYFEAMENYIADFLDNNSNFERWEIANKIEEDLEKILLTNDALTVWAFNGPVAKSLFAADCTDKAKGQIAQVLNKNGRGVIICRSSQANTVEKGKIEELESQMRQFTQIMFMPRPDYKDVPKDVLKKYFPNGGIFCLMDYRNFPEMRSINCKHDVGPGVEGHITTFDMPFVNQRTFNLMVVYT
ncbi:hypothetical protein CRE_15654 [Caenorhabditis remanei]|uniref:Uncharacterized protein n=1 Tax=Caenorhabditis remanei TaxID=31234 RepID=E3N857_CAERE|nr:hypothetical protein CRE_15654 [Caenorhabditis remanei]